MRSPTVGIVVTTTAAAVHEHQFPRVVRQRHLTVGSAAGIWSHDAAASDAVAPQRHADPNRRRRQQQQQQQQRVTSTKTILSFKTNTPNLISILLCLILCCCSYVTAAISPDSPTKTTQQPNPPSGKDVILFDTRAPPEPRMRLIRRAEESSPSSSRSGAAAAATKSSSSSVLSTASSTSPAAVAIPSAFDSSLGNNFTSNSCPDFFSTFLSNDTFNDCVPLSLLLQTSTSFFSVQHSAVELAQTMDLSCHVNFTRCSAVMAEFARDIQLTSNCGTDLQAQNSMVLQAYNGFVAYKPLYSAGCLKNSNTGSYCFADAVTNASSPTDSYVYYLPLGIALPGSSNPTCSNCLRDTMAIFASAATNSSQPVNKVYAPAAKQIDQTCGAGFVNVSIPAASAGSSTFGMTGYMYGSSGLGTLALVAALVAGFV